MDFVWGILMIDEYRATGISDYHTWQIEYEHGQQKRIFVYQQFSKLGTKTRANNSMGSFLSLWPTAMVARLLRVSLWVMGYLMRSIQNSWFAYIRWFGWFSHWNINHLGDFFWVFFFVNIFEDPLSKSKKLVVANGSSRKICGSEHGTIDRFMDRSKLSSSQESVWEKWLQQCHHTWVYNLYKCMTIVYKYFQYMSNYIYTRLDNKCK